ncbi:MFS transporter [Bordetella genomosp. 10]|uniref:MFS transporter n=1 Tax=Bordetella genomosp. 10 TaxID=1416804 RepID=A0A261SIY2_9BORD|nr:MFS transporter [Bordetella genomosp. 10]OZI37115.1 MFS transporter [Bordetella genomosp. 10]
MSSSPRDPAPIAPPAHPAGAAATLAKDTSFRPLSILVGSAYFMEQLDATIISPVIPDIARDFGVDPLSLNLTMTIYLLCSLVFVPMSGLVAARHGTRTVFSWAVGLFTASSVLCAMAPSLATLALFRALQGVAAAMMVPVGRTAIVHTTSKAQLVEALAWFITPAMVGPMLGPPLGGLFSAYLSWHWVFLINVPVGLAGLWAARSIMPQLHHRADLTFDVREWLLAGAALALLILMIERARHGASLPMLAALAVAFAVCVWLYVRRFRGLASPMLDFRLLRLPTFAAGFWGGSLVRVGYGALPFLLPLMLQLGLGYTALQSGIVLLISGSIAFFTKTQTTRLLRRWGFRRVLCYNGLMCAAALAGCALFSLPHWGLVGITAFVSMASFFRAVQFNALTAVSYADLPREKIASATTLNTMAWQLAIMLGISLSALAVQWSANLCARATPADSDFSAAFVLVALFACAAMPRYRALSAQDGAELSGHRAP